MSTIVDAANCSVGAGTGGAWLITKTGGQASTADASAVSSEAMAGDFVLRARALGSGLFYFGVSANPLAGVAPASIDHSLQLNGTSARAYDAGVVKPGTYTISTYLWMRRTGAVLDYLTGPELAGAALKRTITGVAGPLFFDSSLATLGVALEVKFDPIAASGVRKARRLSLGLSF